MTDTTAPRVVLTEVDDMTPEQLAVYEKFQSNLTRALLLTKNSAAAHLALGGTFTVGLLGLLDREVVVLRVAHLRDSEFERFLHYPLARKAGLDDLEIKAIEEADYAQLPPERAALVRYVSECMEDHKASAETFFALRAFYSQSEIAEITHLAGHSAMTAMYLASLDIPIDEGIASWGRLTEVRDAAQGDSA
ncbi:carboxymuconolactone decarboxylase family protein [Streptomyces sp. NPDC059491]|uniref:carboxymuconolactone decarboxylase family protein n=1 Tax=Streptomyces sp. NPDC059491 TaxID=3346850 RepID=UPI0036BAD946